MTDTTGSNWAEILLAPHGPSDIWRNVFAQLRELALANHAPQTLHRQTVVPDRLLAESAWELWDAFPLHAPKAIDELKQFWKATSSSGTAVLILDALSLREMPMIVKGAEERGITPTRIEVRGSEVPTETDRFAEALGLAGRSKLANNSPPASFVFSGTDTFTNVLDAPFEDCLGDIPASPRLFIWHKWPDEPLIHVHEDKSDGHSRVAAETKKQLYSAGFWAFVDRLRKGRRLVITADHGYAVSQSFSSEITDGDTIKLLRQHFHARRCARENPDDPWPRRHLPPLVCKHNGWLVITGQRKWKVQGGFPYLCHRGLTLLEAAVPYIELPAD